MILEALDVGEDLIAVLDATSPVISPIATPATGAFSGTPASSSAIVLPQTEPIEVEPFDDSASETRRSV